MAINRKPRAFKLDEPEPKTPAKAPPKSKKSRKPKSIPDTRTITVISDDEANGIVADLQPPAITDQGNKPGSGWFKLVVVTGIALLSLAGGIALDNLVRELFSRNEWLGWLGTGLSVAFCIALLVLITKEFLSIASIKSIEQIRNDAETARETDDVKAAKNTTKKLDQLLSANPSYAKARAELAPHIDQTTSGADLIHITEQELFRYADNQATELIMNSAKRVSVVTAVSPRAVVDILYVLMENMRLIRMLSQLYGCRPGIWGLLRLSRNVITHLAATGAISVGDGLLQQFVGHGLAARLSTRLGEGVLNGLLTARIGISAMDICRPMAFHARQRPGVADFLSELVKLNGSPKGEKSE